MLAFYVVSALEKTRTHLFRTGGQTLKKSISYFRLRVNKEFCHKPPCQLNEEYILDEFKARSEKILKSSLEVAPLSSGG